MQNRAIIRVSKILNAESKERFLAEGLLAFNTVIWGGTYIAIKLGLEGFTPFLLIGLRYGISALLMGGLLIRARINPVPHLLAGLILGAMLFAGIATQTSGLAYTTAAKSAFISGMFIMFVPFLDWLITGRRARIENYAGILLVTIGLFLLTWPAQGVRAGSAQDLNAGDLLSFACAIAFGIYIVAMDRLVQKGNDLPLAFLQMMTVGGLGIGAALLFESPPSGRPGMSALLSLAYLTLPGTFLMVLIQTRYQPRSNPVRAGIIFSLEPVFAVLFASLILDEQLGPRGMIGAGLMLVGVLVSETYRAIVGRGHAGDRNSPARGV